MKICSIKINGYKNLIDCKYNLEDFNVLIGANNSGKSNFLEVFSFLNVLITGSEEIKGGLISNGELDGDLILSHCKGYNAKTISVEIEFTDEVGGEVYKYNYFIEIVVGDFFFEIPGYINKEVFKYKKITSTGPISTAFERDNTDVKKVKGPKIQKIDGLETLVSLINKIKDIKESFEVPIQKGIDDIFLLCKTPVLYSTPDVIRETIRKPAYENRNGRIVALPLVTEINKIQKSDKGEYYGEILNDILNIEKIQINDITKELKNVTLDFSNGDNKSLNELSDGTLIALNLVTYLLSNRYPIIAIEELENSVHPKLLKKLISLIKNSFSEIQVIITTHSPILLNLVKINEVSIISNKEHGEAVIEEVKNKKELVKKLSGPFSSFSDIFFYTEE